MMGKTLGLFMIIILLVTGIIIAEGQCAIRDPLFTSQQLPTASISPRWIEPAPNQTSPVFENNNKDILSYLNDSKYSTFLKLLKDVRLDSRLSSAQFVVLAPSNEAFPESTLEKITANETILISILEYHIIPGRIDEIDSNRANTLNGIRVNLTQIQNDNQKAVEVENGNVIPINRVQIPSPIREILQNS
jgi:uncharacterized surface protein with fasciclin (FAS1) repeats